jgi:O-antigen/teichoic acid export membrane protein
MELAKRSIEAVGWNIGASLLTTAILFVRSVLLARWLNVETFGSYVLAGSLVSLTVVFVGFGMGAAFINRASETEDEELTASVHFTLKFIFILIWAIAISIYALLFTRSNTQLALFVLIVTTSLIQLSQTPQLILTRRIKHQRLAANQVVVAILTTVVALFLAWNGYELWALLATDIIVALMTVFIFYIWRPVWRIRLAWAPPVIRYFLRMGSQTLPGTVLLQALDRIDDLWTGYFLGTTALGYYSRSYKFATYPRMILAQPINNVATGTYAELKGQRLKLSQAFFRSNSLLVRVGFLFAGVLVLTAPEFILLLLGEKWLPMVNIFRLMIIYTLLDPIKLTVANLFLAVGDPKPVVKTRIIQLCVMMIGLFTLGMTMGTIGVALTVDIMLFVGMVILFFRVRQYVDFSLRAMFMLPSIALISALLVGWFVASYMLNDLSPWVVLFVKGLVFSCVYAGLLLLEKQNIKMLLRLLRYQTGNHIVRKDNQNPGDF